MLVQMIAHLWTNDGTIVDKFVLVLFDVLQLVQIL